MRQRPHLDGPSSPGPFSTREKGRITGMRTAPIQHFPAQKPLRINKSSKTNPTALSMRVHCTHRSAGGQLVPCSNRCESVVMKRAEEAQTTEPKLKPAG